MDLGIQGRVALVGASGRGLGLRHRAASGHEGCDVAICDIDAGVLDAALESVRAINPGGRAAAYQVDLTSPDSIEQLVEGVRRDLGVVSILVNNSGGPPPAPSIWPRTRNGARLPAHLPQRRAPDPAVLPDMQAQRWGRIINFTSRSLKEPIPNLMISNAVRLAVGGMAKTLAGRWHPTASPSTTSAPDPRRPTAPSSWRPRGRPRRGSAWRRSWNRRPAPSPWAAWRARGAGRSRGVPGLRAGRLHHRHLPARRRWRGEGPVIAACAQGEETAHERFFYDEGRVQHHTHPLPP